jgi:hypothetical protein
MWHQMGNDNGGTPRSDLFIMDLGAPSNSTQAIAPSCSPGSGIVPQTVTCTNPNTGTTVMCYATGATTPVTNGVGTGCTTGTQYTTALTIFVAETLNVVAGTSLLTDSNEVSYTYTSGVNPGTIMWGVTAEGVTIP